VVTELYSNDLVIKTHGPQKSKNTVCLDENKTGSTVTVTTSVTVTMFVAVTVTVIIYIIYVTQAIAMTGQHNSRDTKGGGRGLFCNSGLYEFSVTVTVTVMTVNVII
jgi:hypothetical protein